MIEYVKGDLFDKDLNLDALCHGVNCLGVMGAGIAAQFKQNYFAMYLQYRRKCIDYDLRPGDLFTYETDTKPVRFVYNLASQMVPGRDARLGAIVSAVDKMAVHADANNVKRLGVPQIGAGIGGLKWDDVHSALLPILEPLTTTYVMVEWSPQATTT